MLNRYDGPAPDQMPDKSGLPSGVRGAGADRFGLPSGSRGIPGVGKLSHCAKTAVGTSDSAKTRHTARRTGFRRMRDSRVEDYIRHQGLRTLRRGILCAGRGEGATCGRRRVHARRCQLCSGS
jgi:hypothetical protein